MTEPELIEAITSFMSVGQGSTITLTTMLSGYLIVAYLVGAKLTRAQVVVVNCLYVPAMLASAAGAFGAVSKAAQYASALKEIKPDDVIFLSQSNAFVSLAFSTTFLLASLWFMWDIRHRKTE